MEPDKTPEIAHISVPRATVELVVTSLGRAASYALKPFKWAIDGLVELHESDNPITK